MNQNFFCFFLRPRRFGEESISKYAWSLFDIYYKDRFNEIFDNTYILNNPTALKNSFYILKFDFSAVDISDLENSFRLNLYSTLIKFIKKYNLDIKIDKQDHM